MLVDRCALTNLFDCYQAPAGTQDPDDSREERPVKLRILKDVVENNVRDRCIHTRHQLAAGACRRSVRTEPIYQIARSRARLSRPAEMSTPMTFRPESTRALGYSARAAAEVEYSAHRRPERPRLSAIEWLRNAGDVAILDATSVTVDRSPTHPGQVTDSSLPVLICWSLIAPAFAQKRSTPHANGNKRCVRQSEQ